MSDYFPTLFRPEDYEDGIKELNNSPVEKRFHLLHNI